MARTTPINSGYTILDCVDANGSNGYRVDVWVEYRISNGMLDAYFYAATKFGYSTSTSHTYGLNSTFRVGDNVSEISGGSYDFRSSGVVNLLGSYHGTIQEACGGSDTVTISGSFTTASTYITGGSITGTVDVSAGLGNVYIHDGTSYQPYQVYIYDGESYSQYIPYIYNGSTWEAYSG